MFVTRDTIAAVPESGSLCLLAAGLLIGLHLEHLWTRRT